MPTPQYDRDLNNQDKYCTLSWHRYLLHGMLSLDHQKDALIHREGGGVVLVTIVLIGGANTNASYNGFRWYQGIWDNHSDSEGGCSQEVIKADVLQVQ